MKHWWNPVAFLWVNVASPFSVGADDVASFNSTRFSPSRFIPPHSVLVETSVLVGIRDKNAIR
jgi:hypothetical protein